MLNMSRVSLYTNGYNVQYEYSSIYTNGYNTQYEQSLYTNGYNALEDDLEDGN